MSPSNRFGLPDLEQGRLPCWGGTQRLSRAVRPSRAGAMVLTGQPIDAAEALQLGLVHAVADDPMAARLSSPARIMVICDGVHCRWVTPWRSICAASE